MPSKKRVEGIWQDHEAIVVQRLRTEDSGKAYKYFRVRAFEDFDELSSANILEVTGLHNSYPHVMAAFKVLLE